MSTLGSAAGIYTQRGGAISLKTMRALIAGFRIRIRVFWSNLGPVLKTGSDLDPVLELGRIQTWSEHLVLKSIWN